MSAFIDASAIVAVLSHEPDGSEVLARIEAAGRPLYFSAVSVFEATFGLVRKKTQIGRRADAATLVEAGSIIRDFLERIGAEEVPVDGAAAIEAAARFGKVVGHPAQLNIGDCFAYACARAKGVPLLYKGDDIARTDLAPA